MGTSSQGFDLMNDDMEDETSNEHETVEECDDSSGNKQMVVVEYPGELAGKERPEPYVGLEFKSADEAREYYSEYARLNGFTVRVNRKRRSRIDRAVIGFDYVCSKEGFRRRKDSKEEKILRLSKQTRVGCKAILVIAYRRDIERWVVTNFVKEHNHELMVPSEVPVRHIDKSPLNEDDKDKKIRELTTKLYNEKQRFHRQCAAYEERCADYKAQLSKILKDIELHTEHLTNKVQDVVQSIKEIEDEEDSDQDHYQPPAILKCPKNSTFTKAFFGTCPRNIIIPCRSVEDAKKIRELSYALHRANRRCTVYREQLDMVLKDIEKHTDHLSVKVQEIVNSITEIDLRR